MTQRFTLQLIGQPPPWIPHLHYCPSCAVEFACDMPGACAGYVRYREHLSCPVRYLFQGADFAYSASLGVYLAIGAGGQVKTSKDGFAWVSAKDPHLSKLQRVRATGGNDWTQPNRSPLALMEDFEDAVDRIRGQRFDRIVVDDPVVEEPMTDEKRRQAQQWMSKLVLGREDMPERPLPLAVNHFNPRSHLAGDTPKPRRRRKRRRRR